MCMLHHHITGLHRILGTCCVRSNVPLVSRTHRIFYFRLHALYTFNHQSIYHHKLMVDMILVPTGGLWLVALATLATM